MQGRDAAQWKGFESQWTWWSGAQQRVGVGHKGAGRGGCRGARQAT